MHTVHLIHLDNRK